MACCTILSMTLGIPRFLVLPPSLGISTLRTGLGRYFPSRICPLRFSSPIAVIWLSSPSVPIPSTPALPLLAHTLSYAFWRFRLSSILSSKSVRFASVVLFSDIQHSLGSPATPSTFRASAASGLPPLRVQLLPSSISEVSFIYYVPPDVPAFRVSPYYAFI